MIAPAKTALAVRHVPFEDLGSLAAVLKQHGYAVAYREAGLDDLGTIEPAGPDLVVVLGGPIGAYEEDAYPFIRDELRLLGRRLAADLPTLGICLGAQLMARALGAKVYPGHGKEIGWSRLRLTEDGRRSCLQCLSAEKTPVLHWHGDTFDLPDDAIRLASTDAYQNQAFAWGSRGLALQFHAEVRAKDLERWFIGHACEIAGASGLSVAQLRRDTARWAPALESQGPQAFDAWLRALPPGR